jgi:hypothetical protein
MRFLTTISAVLSIVTAAYAQSGPQAAKIPACVVSQNFSPGDLRAVSLIFVFSCLAIPKRSQRQHAQVLTNSATANNRVLS